jgi:hypothetical protein
MLTWDGKLISWLFKKTPNVADKIIYHEMVKEDNTLV